MRRRTTLITTAAVGVAGLGTGLGLWLAQPSYNDIVKGCQKALTAQYKAGGKGKPSACKDVKQDDYDALAVEQVLRNSGVVDDDGNVDLNRVLDDPDSQP